MSRLPVAGQDHGVWGAILNDFLLQAHNADGTLKAGSVGTSALADGNLPEIAELAPSNDEVIQHKAGVWTSRSPTQFKADLALVKADVGLANVDNTSDAAKPVSTATQTALDNKVTGGNGIQAIVRLTQAAYDALGTPDPNTLYVVVG